MAAEYSTLAAQNRVVDAEDAILVGVSMFGLTTQCVSAACKRLRELRTPDQRRIEPVVFHATGAGGRTMERLLKEKVLLSSAERVY